MKLRRQDSPPVPALETLRRPSTDQLGGGLFGGPAAAQLAARIWRAQAPTEADFPAAPVGISVPDALIALQDALDDPVVWMDLRLTALALDAELITTTQRALLMALLYELADAFQRATA